MAQIPLLRVFVSSPGDVVNERKLALDVIDRLPDRPAFREKVAFRVIAWDKVGADTPMLGTLSPQEAISTGLPKPSECDIVIVIFWSRIGTPFYDPQGKRWLSGTYWEMLDGLGSDTTQTVIYRRTQPVLFSYGEEEKRRQYEQLVGVFSSELFYQDGQIIRGINTYETSDDFRAKFEIHFESLVQNALDRYQQGSVSRDTHSATHNKNIKTVTTKTWQGSPFPGLRPFTPDDAPIFFGRGIETDQLIDKVSANRLVCIVGDSGSGKSSLVNAGLLPRLSANAIYSENAGSKDWIVVRFTPGDSPYEALAASLMDHIPTLGCQDPIDYPERMERLAASLAQRPDRLVKTLEYVLKDERPWVEVLLFVDELEKLLTATDEQVQSDFMQMIASHSGRLRTIITMRADFYHRVVSQLEEPLRNGTFTLGPPSQVALHEMITRPAERAALTFDRGLPERIVAETGTDPGSLALLAYTLDELYNLSQARGDRRITFSDYEKLGGVQGAIGTRAESVFAGLFSDEIYREQLIQRVFYRLVDVDEGGTATRRRVLLSTFEDDDDSLRLIDALTKARLLVQGCDDNDQPTVEVAHDALFRSWPILKRSIESIQDDLILLRQVRQAAEEWNRRGKNRAFLWPHERLTFVYQMMERLGCPEVAPLVRDFMRPEQEWLLDELNDLDTSHARRSTIGQRLDVIGDQRPGIGLGVSGLPDIVWLPVAEGTVLVDGVSFDVRPFYIAKYQITHRQFQAFVNDGGYGNDVWWSGLYRREEEPPDQQTIYLNHPRDSMRWVDAMAFCRWLSARYTGQPNHLPQSVRIGEHWQVRLPLEAEWQLAATGGDDNNMYPWGTTWDGRRANTREAGLSQTTAVGMYPDGAAPCGALDMSGNICEWCCNAYEQIENISTNHDVNRVRRGGSCNHYKETARTTFRFDFDPGYRFSHDLGVRVVLAPPLT